MRNGTRLTRCNLRDVRGESLSGKSVADYQVSEGHDVFVDRLAVPLSVYSGH